MKSTDIVRAKRPPRRRVRFSERISVSFVYVSAGATIGVLFLILGYILFNGFFYKNRVEYPAASFTSDSAAGLVALANTAVKRKELTFDVLRGIYTDGYANWKKISDSAADIYPYLSAQAAARAQSVFGGIGRLSEVSDGVEKMLLYAASNPGGIVLITEEEYEAFAKKIPHQLRRISLRNVALACNTDVTELFGNFKIGTIDESSIEKIYTGSITNWQQLGGKDLPITVILPSSAQFFDSAVSGESEKQLASLFAHAERAERTERDGSAHGGGAARYVYASDSAEYTALLRTVSGAAGLLPLWYADDSIDSLRLARTERGVNLTPAFIFEKPVDGGRFGGISSIILNTLMMIVLTLLFSVPPGLFAAVYLVEYAKEGRLMQILRLGTETLAGIPSIIFGLFGMLIFVQGFGWGICLLSGSLTLALMILPTVVRTAEEALKAVPHSLQEGSLALGGTKIQTIFRVVLPAAFPSISAGIILATGRALGETAALIYTMGSSYNLAHGVFDSTRTLAVHVYLIIAEGISTDKAFAAGTVLIFFIFIINSAAKMLIKRIGARGR